MSLNILTADGLKEVGKVTKEKVLSALDYTPANVEDLPNIQEDGSGDLFVADKDGNYVVRVSDDGIHATEIEVNGMLLGETLSAHTADSEIHVTAAEKEAWDSKSGFSGVYDDLLNKPNLEDDESGNLQISDENGNVVAQFDENGLTTTEVTAGGVKLSETLVDHIIDDTAHITEAERKAWNEKSDFSGVYSDLIGEPNITEDESGIFQISDDKGNVAVQVDNEGLKAGTVSADKVLISGEDIKNTVDTHKGDDVAHITADERDAWNAKSDFSGLYSDLVGEPNITEDESGIFQISDDKGNIAVQVDNAGLKAATVTAETVIADVFKIGEQTVSGLIDGVAKDLSDHKSDTTAHITAGERSQWNQNITDLDEHNADSVRHITASERTAWNTVTDVADRLNAHDTDSVRHITAEERESWNAKSEFSGRYEDLIGEPNILEDNSTVFQIVDDNGNIGMEVSNEGVKAGTVTATTVKADVIMIGEASIKSKFDELNSAFLVHNSDTDVHISTAERADWNAKATPAYVDQKIADLVDSVAEELAKKADAEHGHDISDVVNLQSTLDAKAEKTELHAHENKAVLDEISAERVTSWDNKSEFSGRYEDLEGEPSISEDTSGELQVADDKGNIVAKISVSGIETTAVKAGSFTLVRTETDDEGKTVTTETEVGTALDEQADEIALKASAAYVEETFETKADAGSKLAEAKGYTDSAAANCVQTAAIVNNLTTEDASKVLAASQGVVLQDQIDEINDILADLLYEAITFTKFTNNVGTVELGKTIDTITFTWETNKTPATLALDGVSIDASLTGYTYSDLGLCPTSVTTKKYTISATDDREATASKETSITFVNGVYYGKIDASATIDSDAVLAMSKKLQNSRGMTVTITPGDTEYIAFAFPSRLGTPTFKMGGFETTCNCTTIQFTNASGFEEEYNVYTSAHTGLGKTEVVVS